jgi:hypothetical protein
MSGFLSKFGFFTRRTQSGRNAAKSLAIFVFVESVDFVAGNKRAQRQNSDPRFLSNFVSRNVRARSIRGSLFYFLPDKIDKIDKLRPSALVAAERHSVTFDKTRQKSDEKPGASEASRGRVVDARPDPRSAPVSALNGALT